MKSLLALIAIPLIPLFTPGPGCGGREKVSLEAGLFLASLYPPAQVRITNQSGADASYSVYSGAGCWREVLQSYQATNAQTTEYKEINVAAALSISRNGSACSAELYLTGGSEITITDDGANYTPVYSSN